RGHCRGREVDPRAPDQRAAAEPGGGGAESARTSAKAVRVIRILRQTEISVLRAEIRLFPCDESTSHPVQRVQNRELGLEMADVRPRGCISRLTPRVSRLDSGLAVAGEMPARHIEKD